MFDVLKSQLSLQRMPLLATFFGMACAIHKPPPLQVKSLPQCFELHLGACEWSMPIPDYWLKRSADEAFPRRLPTAIRLEATAPTKGEYGVMWDPDSLVAKPCSTIDFDSRYKLGTWRLQSDGSVQFAWGGGLEGVILRAPALDSAILGTITTWSDAIGNPMPICEITLARRACKCP
jgi:hypothetical protein